MAISIIIAAYNTEKYIAAAIESVLLQTIEEWEVVVVDDGSTDKTGAIAETFSREDSRIQVVHQANAGISMARNRGFTEARTDYKFCMFLDSDDLLEPNALEILLQALEKDPNAVGAHGMLRYIDSEGKPLAVGGSFISPRRRRGIQGRLLKVWPESAPTTFAVLAYAPFIITSGLMIRRAKKEAAGHFDPSLKQAEDWHMYVRLSRLGDIAFLNRVVFAYRRHEKNITNQRELMHASIFLARKKLYNSIDLNKREKRTILIGHRYYELYLAKLSFFHAYKNLLQGRLADALNKLHSTMTHIILSLKVNL